MKPIIVLVGRPNVGKSTLFNRLTKSRDAIVADVPGLTRDRHYGHGRGASKPFLVVDTGGFEPVAAEGIMQEMARQTLQAIAEADAIIFVTDARQGLTPQDKRIAETLRKSALSRGVAVRIAANKAEGLDEAISVAEFHELALGDPEAISAAHGDGVRDLIEKVLATFPEAVDEGEPDHPKIAIVGRPNVGKSTLVNRMLGEDRVIAFDEPGTTRDSIYVPLSRNGRDYTLIDTAGIRRRGKTFEAIEKFSVVKTLQAIDDANVVVLLLDAHAEIADQDAHIAGFILDAGRALVVAVNKWDDLESGERDHIKSECERKLRFLGFASLHFISALQGKGLGQLFASIDTAFAAAMAKLSTPRLTRALIAATEAHQPPMNGLHRPKLRYAHQGGTNPPVVVVHGSGLDGLPASYVRYLENAFRDAFKLKGTPLRIELKKGANPYAERKSKPLTASEERKRRKEKRYRKRTFA